VHTFFNNQFYTLDHGLSPDDQRAHDRSAGEFADALTEFWSQRSRRHRGFKRWLTVRRNVRAFVEPSRSTLVHLVRQSDKGGR